MGADHDLPRGTVQDFMSTEITAISPDTGGLNARCTSPTSLSTSS